MLGAASILAWDKNARVLAVCKPISAAVTEAAQQAFVAFQESVDVIFSMLR